jgi:hypothetical protein
VPAFKMFVSFRVGGLNRNSGLSTSFRFQAYSTRRLGML